jgi:hypothetical protein
MRRALVALVIAIGAGTAGPVAAHHGVASLGVAGLQGPGAPVETSSSATLPQGKVLLYTKLDFARFEHYTPEVDDEGDYNAFWMYGIGYGITSYLSAYVLAPFYTKKVEDNSYNTSGFADLSLMTVVGFKLDDGLMLTPANESLDDLGDWHFTLYGGMTLPTGDADITDASGAIDPGMSLGFGQPSFSAGVTTTRLFRDRITAVADASYIGFRNNTYADGSQLRFGDEVRFNAAVTARTLTIPGAQLRVDANLEGNYLYLGRDELEGAGEPGTGGHMVYAAPGLRLFYRTTSVGVALKFPVWTDLNEEPEQQGAEGTEDYRFVLTLSVMP